MKNFIIQISLFTFFICLIYACRNLEKVRLNTAMAESEIEKLYSLSDKEIYLTEVFETDQNFRNKKSKILWEFGKNPKEYLKVLSERDSIDQLNYERINLYLKEFPYPAIDSFSQMANSAPWLVIHHSGLRKRKRHFMQLYTAYLNNALNTDQFELYLTRTFQIKKGFYPKTEGAYQQDKKINDMIWELGLE